MKQIILDIIAYAGVSAIVLCFIFLALAMLASDYLLWLQAASTMIVIYVLSVVTLKIFKP